MMTRTTERLLQTVAAAAGSLAGLFVIQGAGCLALALTRNDAIGATAFQAACASAALLVVAVVARSQSRQGPAMAAAMVAALLTVELLMWGVLVGVPALPFMLQVSLSTLVYGGLSSMAIAAGFACWVLAHADLAPSEVAQAARRRASRRAGRRARRYRGAA